MVRSGVSLFAIEIARPDAVGRCGASPLALSKRLFTLEKQARFMCGRITRASPREAIAKEFGVTRFAEVDGILATTSP